MREILFKAKSITTGEWVEGSLMYNEDAEEGWESIIIPCDCNFYVKNDGTGDIGIEDWYRVDKDTICQYTGLTDKNGNKIWENDIVKEVKSNKRTFKITYDVDAFCIDGNGIMLRVRNVRDKIEVIGNIFDNPELLGV